MCNDAIYTANLRNILPTNQAGHSKNAAALDSVVVIAWTLRFPPPQVGQPLEDPRRISAVCYPRACLVSHCGGRRGLRCVCFLALRRTCRCCTRGGEPGRERRERETLRGGPPNGNGWGAKRELGPANRRQIRSWVSQPARTVASYGARMSLPEADGTWEEVSPPLALLRNLESRWLSVFNRPS